MIRRAICWLLGHRPLVVGRCSQKNPHFCSRQQTQCKRCNRIQYQDGAWRYPTPDISDWAERQLRQWKE